MTHSPIIPSGSHSTWSKWAKSQSIWTDTLETVDGRSEIRPLTPLIVPTCNKPPLVEDRSRWNIFKGRQRWLHKALMTSLSLTLLINKWFYPVMLPFPKAKGNHFKPSISQKFIDMQDSVNQMELIPVMLQHDTGWHFDLKMN